MAPTCTRAARRSHAATRAKSRYDRSRVADLDHSLRAETPRHGLWLDTSDLTVDETVDTILSRIDEALAV